MKSHDFGQFLYNDGQLSERQMSAMIEAAKRSEPTLAVEALFLQLISAAELTELLNSSRTLSAGEAVRELITPRQALRAEELKDGQSIRFAQALVDNGLANYLKLERLIDRYHSSQVPPLESMLAVYYDRSPARSTIDFPFAIDLLRGFHEFLSETLNSTIIILSPTPTEFDHMVGASVKLSGDLTVVTGIVSDEPTFMKLASKYDSAVDLRDPIEDGFDAVSELLNVFVGHFAVRAAMQRGLEEEPEPPRFGEPLREPEGFMLMADVGKFLAVIDRDELLDRD